MNYDEKEKIKKKKYKKYTLSGLIIVALTFLLEYSMEFLLDGIFKSDKKENSEKIVYDVSVEEDSSEESENKIESPFKASDIEVEIIKTNKVDDLVNIRITNNSKTPLTNLIMTINFDDGETSLVLADYGTIMPGKSHVLKNGTMEIDGEIKDFNGGEPVSAFVDWVGDDKKRYLSSIDFLLDIVDTCPL